MVVFIDAVRIFTTWLRRNIQTFQTEFSINNQIYLLYLQEFTFQNELTIRILEKLRHSTFLGLKI